MFLFTRKVRRFSPLPVYIDKYGIVHQPIRENHIEEDMLEFEKMKKLGLTFGYKKTRSKRKKK